MARFSFARYREDTRVGYRSADDPPFAELIGGFSADGGLIQPSTISNCLAKAGLAQVVDVTTRGSDSPVARILSISWARHEFLDAARNNTVWNRTTDRLKDACKTLLTVSLSVLTALLVDEAKPQMGLLP